MPTLAPPSPASAPPVPAVSRRDPLFAGAAIGAVLIALTAMTWQKWPDLLVDFGVQLYIPWRLASGAVLYRDIAYLTGGPLSQYFNALVFRIFGASVLTLVFANLAVLAGLLAVVYRTFHRIGDQLTAVAGCLAILLAFAFEHYSNYGIFSYITPYSEELYHGLALSILALALLCDWINTQNQKWALAAGFCAGLVFLTKPEIFLAVTVTFAVALFIGWRAVGNKFVARGAGLMALAGAVPPLGFFLYFLCHGSVAQSIAWTCWAWTPVLTTATAHDRFYHWCLGLDAPKFYVKWMFVQFAGLAAILAVCAFVFRIWNNGWRAAVACMALAAAFAVPAWRFKWEECGHCLPLVMPALLALVGWRVHKSGWRPENVFGFLWSAFSLVMLAKLGYHTRIWHYGFVLAMPASLGAIYLILRLLPLVLEPLSVSWRWWRFFFCAFLGVALLQLTLGSKFIYQKKTVPIASGADRLWTFSLKDDDTGPRMVEAFDWLQAHTPANSTLAPLPSGAMLNFLLRRPNPTSYLRWNPAEMAGFGQTNMVRSFEEHPPTYVLLLGVDYSEFGVRFFGDTPAFGQDLLQWINTHYRQVNLIGGDWKKNGEFGIKILEWAPPK